MQPPLANNSSNTNTVHLSQEHRTRLYQLVNELNDDQLRVFLTTQLPSVSNTHSNNPFQFHSRTQLIQQAYVFIDNCYSTDLEHALHTLSQKRFAIDYRQEQYQHQQQQQPPQQQQQMYRPPQQNYAASFNPQPYYYGQQPPQYNTAPNYRFPAAAPPPLQGGRTLTLIRPNVSSVSSNNVPYRSPSATRPPSQAVYFAPAAPRQQHSRPPPNPAPSTNGSLSTLARCPSPPAPPLPPTPPAIVRPPLPTSFSPRNILHKTLPFYRSLSCIYECHQVFRYDNYRKHYYFRHELLLSLDVCNQLALSYDYDPDLDAHKTGKRLILRLVRLDQTPMANGKYDDSLPPNLTVHINSQNLTNLPTPKPCTRNQTDLIRVGRELDITSYCMFNPSLPNDLSITWSYRTENAPLHAQYANAQYALHIFLVDHMTVDDLCEQIKRKPSKFYRDDLVRLVAGAKAHDLELDLEVGDQILKLKCPIDQRRLRIPIRASTCQHLQCFDLTNYIALNEKAGKWICPVCNKPAMFDDLQIDAYLESILYSIDNETVNEIRIDNDLNWVPVSAATAATIEHHHLASNVDDIILDDDTNDGQYEPIDTKSHIPLIKSSNHEPNDLILIDDD